MIINRPMYKGLVHLSMKCRMAHEVHLCRKGCMTAHECERILVSLGCAWSWKQRKVLVMTMKCTIMHQTTKLYMRAHMNDHGRIVLNVHIRTNACLYRIEFTVVHEKKDECLFKINQAIIHRPVLSDLRDINGILKYQDMPQRENKIGHEGRGIHTKKQSLDIR